MGDPIPSSSEELLKKQGDSRTDSNKKTRAAGDKEQDLDGKK